MTGQTILEVRHIVKSFPGVRALSDVSLSIRRGEIHAIVGENGAGKSTLMKILAGAYSKDEGEIVLNGAPVEINSPADAQNLRIAIIYQEFNSALHLSAEANIFLGREIRSKFLGVVDSKRMRREAEALIQELGVRFDVTVPVRELNVSQQQVVEIAKALSMDAEIIIMDEPTSALAETEVTNLFNTIRHLKEKGITFIYISHNLQEVFEIADRVTVLRDGTLIGTQPTSELTPQSVIRMMVGRTLDELFPKPAVTIGGPLLEVKNLSRGTMVRDVSFSLREGEILGIAGLLGSGRTDVVRCIFGADRPEAGEIWLRGRKLDIRSPLDALSAGIGLAPEDRRLQGLFISLPLRVNLCAAALSTLTSCGVIDRHAETEMTEQFVSSLAIKTTGPEQPVGNLSGGNQQKVVLAKWLAIEPSVLILDDPTRGVDVGAKVAIHELMGELIKRGIGIILISSELPEVLGMSDRILVMCRGRITGEFSRQEASQERIMACATGQQEHVMTS